MDQELLFGRWLRKRRRALDLTQKELARRAGCSPATIRKIEAEQRRPSKATAGRLAASLGIAESERSAFLGFARRGWLSGPLAVATTGGELLPWHTPPLQAPPLDGMDTPAPHLDGTEESTEPPGPVFVARERELADLERHLDFALERHGRVVFVTGEPDSGKTALMAEFARRAQAAYPVLLCAAGSCNALSGEGDPCLPFRDLMEMLCGDAFRPRWTGPLNAVDARRLWDALPDTLRALVDEGPELIDVFVSRAGLVRRAAERAASGGTAGAEVAAWLGRGAVAVHDPGQRLLLEQYARVLRRLADRHPLLLLVDDLQWADDASIDLLFHLGRRLAGSRVLIVGAYRPNEVAQGRKGMGDNDPHPLAPVVAEFAGHFGDIRVDLDRIPPEESRAFVDALLDSEPNTLGEGFRASLFGRTEGHPLFAVELLRDLQARGDLARDGHGRWREGSELVWQSLPVRVDAVIEQRLSRLNGQLRESLQIASVEGEEFTAQVVAGVQKVDELQLLRDLSQTLERRQRLVREVEDSQPASGGRTRYRFAHALFQQHLYTGLGAGQRRLLHGGVARALEEVYRDELDEIAVQLAHHYSQAGDAEQARAYLVRAGLRAQRLAALDDAARFYRAALERWPAVDPRGRAEAQRRLAEWLWMTGHLPEALEVSEASRFAYESLGDPVAAGALERQIGRLYWELGDRQRSLAHYHKALATLEQGPEGVELARAVSSISQMHMLAADFDLAIEWGERALALAERLGAEDVAVHARCNLGVALTSTGDPEGGSSMLRETARRAVELGLPHDAGRAYHCLCENLMWLCRYAEARTALDEMIAYATRAHVAMFMDTSRIFLAELDWLEGRWATALASLAGLVDEWRSSRPEGIVRLLACTFQGAVWNDLGRARAAAETLEGSLATARSSNEQQIIVPYTGQLARAYAALGREADTRAVIHEFRRWLESDRYIKPYGTLVPVLFACRWFASRQAWEDARACLRLLERADQQLGTPETCAVLLEGRGVVSVAEGDAPSGLEPLQAAASRWENLGRPYDRLRALSALGQGMKTAGDENGAQQVLQNAADIVDALAGQLEDPEAKRAFLASPLLREIHVAQG